MSSKIALITGAGGFIGIHLAKLLKKKGFEVHGILSSLDKNLFLDRKFVADIRKFEDLESVIDNNTKYIFHLAGVASIQKSIDDPSLDFHTNAVGTFNMLELSRGLNLESFVFASSVSVLDPNNKLPINETAIYAPSTPYGASKMSAETYCKVYHSCYNVPVKILRLFNVYGPGKIGLVVHDLIKKLLKNNHELTLHGDGEQVRDFLFIDDAISGFDLIAQKGKEGEIYHVGSGIPTSIISLTNIIINQMNLNQVKIKTTGKFYKGEMLEWYADISKISELGFSAKIGIEEGIAKTIEWIKN